MHGFDVKKRCTNTGGPFHLSLRWQRPAQQKSEAQ